MQWYYSKNGNQLGPVEEGDLRAKVATGEVSPTDLVWRDGMTDWLPSSRVPELAVAAASPTAYTDAGQISGGVVNSPYSPPRAQQGVAPYSGPEIPNYLWQSIVVTILCCWPFGIPAIVYAAKVDGLKAQGNVMGAMDASANAKKWCIVAASVWGVGAVIWFIAVGSSIIFSRH